MKAISSTEFTDFICQAVESFDDQIIQKREPLGKWVELPPPKWWLVREKVRKLSEGLAFIPSHKAPVEREWRGDQWIGQVSTAFFPQQTTAEYQMNRLNPLLE